MYKNSRFLLLLMALIMVFTFSFTTTNFTVFADNILNDDFESYAIGSFPGGGWSRQSGTWAIAQDGSQVLYQSTTAASVLCNGDLSWTNYSVSAKVKCAGGGTILGRYQDSANFYMLKMSTNSFCIQKKVAGAFTTLDSTDFICSSSTFYTLKLEMNGDSIRGYLNDVLMVSATDFSLGSGKIALRCESTCTYDDVVVYQMLPTVTTVPASYPGLRDSNGNLLPTPTPHAVTGTTRIVSADTADNSTDDRPAIEAAINAAVSGDEIYLPNGVYNLNTPSSTDSLANICLKNGVNIRGQSQNGVILKTNFDVGTNDNINYAVIKGVGCNDILISKLTVTSTFNRQYSNDTSTQNPDRGGPRFGIQLTNSGSTYSYNVTIDSVTVEKFEGHGGINLNNTRNVVVKNSDLKNATNVAQGGYGINLLGTSSYYNVVDNCNFIGFDEGYLRHGIIVQYSSHNNLIKNSAFTDVLIDALDFHGEDEYSNEACGNYFSGDLGEAAIGIGNPGATHDAAGPNNWIHNNFIYNCRYGVRVLFGTPNTVIQNNEITGVQSISGSGGIALGNAPNTVVQGNYIHDNISSGYEAVYLYHDTGSIWGDGTVHNPGDPTNVTLMDNIVKNNYYGFRIEAGSISSEYNNTASNNTSRNYMKVLNPSFENDQASVQTPAAWNESGSVSASYVTNLGTYSGSYELRFSDTNSFNVTTSQTITVPNNTYTLKARVKSTGGQTTAVMTASNFGGTTLSKDIKAAKSSWTSYSISGINVTNGSCTLEFNVASPSGQTLEVDSVELFY